MIANHRLEVMGWDLDGILIDRYQDMGDNSRSIHILFHKAYGQSIISVGNGCIEDVGNTGSVMVPENTFADLDITERRANDVTCWGSTDMVTAIINTFYLVCFRHCKARILILREPGGTSYKKRKHRRVCTSISSLNITARNLVWCV